MVSRLFRSGNQLGLVLGKSREDLDNGQYLMSNEVQRQLMHLCCEAVKQSSYRVIVCDYDAYLALKDKIETAFKFNTAGKNTELYNMLVKGSNITAVKDTTRGISLVMPAGKRVLMMYQEISDLHTNYWFRIFGETFGTFKMDALVFSHLRQVTGVAIGHKITSETLVCSDSSDQNSIPLKRQQDLFKSVAYTMRDICNPKHNLEWRVKLGLSTDHLAPEEYMTLLGRRYQMNVNRIPSRHGSPLVILDARTFYLAMNQTGTAEDVLRASFVSNNFDGDALTCLLDGIFSACSIIVPLYSDIYHPAYVLIRKTGNTRDGKIVFAAHYEAIDYTYCETVWTTLSQILTYMSTKKASSTSFNDMIAKNIFKCSQTPAPSQKSTLNPKVYRRYHARLLDDCCADELARLIGCNQVAKLHTSNFSFKHYMTD